MKTNILLIMSDQQRPDTIGCYGNIFCDTPNTDRLGREGVIYKNAFTVWPLCTPARATMWTGVYPHSSRIVDVVYGVDDVIADSEHPVTVFQTVQAAGYETAYFGKWHLGSRQPEGIEIWKAFNSGGGHWVDGKQAFQGGTYMPEIQTADMIDYLQKRPKDARPFFAVQSYYPPHDPYTAPEEYMNRYRGKGIPFPGYYACVTALDAYIGRVLTALKEAGNLDNTLIIFTSDHGEHFNFRYLFGHANKATGHEEAIRIPLIVRVPGNGGHSLILDDPVGLQDIVPTILDYAGCEIPDDLHGMSLRPSLEDKPERQCRDCFYIQNTADHRSEEAWSRIMMDEVYRADTRAGPSPTGEWVRQRALWTEDWKLVTSEDGKHLLYDLRIDPEENYNLYGVPKRDIYSQYLHFEDHTPIFLDLVLRLRNEAAAIDDDLGIELADQAMSEGRALADKITETSA